MIRRALAAVALLPPFCLVEFCSAQVSLISRHSEARERSRDQLGVIYDNQASFDGPGLRQGTLPRGVPYNNFANESRIGGVFNSHYSSSRDFSSRSNEGSMDARISITGSARVNIAFSADGVANGPYTDCNAAMTITNVQTGAVVYSMQRDASFRVVDNAWLVWDARTVSLTLEQGLYDIEMTADIQNIFNSGSGTSLGTGRLTAEMTITVPAPSALTMLGAIVFVPRRRRNFPF